jgi:tetratricopeptide (TPR) repeat protein
MNWKIVGIVTLAVLCLIGFGGTLWGGYKIARSLMDGAKTDSLAANRIQCNSHDPAISIAGCTAILQSSEAQDADRTYAYFQRGISYERHGDLDLAIQDDSEVIRRSPKEYMAWNNRGFAHLRKGDPGDLDLAIADLDHAVELEPEMTIARFNRGEAYNLKGDEPKAIDDFSGVIKLEPKNAMAWNNRCYYRAIEGQLDDALADCNQSLKLNPNVGATLDSRAFTYLKMKKYDLAIADYDNAINRFGNQPLWLYGRGLARRGKHDISGAKTDMDAATQIDPKIVERYRKLGIS